MMPFVRPGAVVGLDAGGRDRRVAPAGGDQLLGRRRVGSRAAGRRGPPRPAGPPRRRRRPAPAAAANAAEHHHHRHRPRCRAGVTSVICDVDGDRRVRRVVHVADELPCRPTSAHRSCSRALTRPRHLRHVPRARGRRPRARSPRRSPAAAASTSVGGRHLRCRSSSVRTRAGWDRDSPAPRRSSRGWAPARCRSARTQRRDAELLHHVPMIVGRGPAARVGASPSPFAPRLDRRARPRAAARRQARRRGVMMLIPRFSRVRRALHASRAARDLHCFMAGIPSGNDGRKR